MFSLFKHSPDHFDRNQRTDSVVHSHKGTFRYLLQSIPYGMKPCYSSVDDGLRTDEVALQTIILPVPYMIGRKHSHHRYARTSLKKDLDGPLEDRLASEFQKLLGSGSPHSRTAAGSHYDNIFLPFHTIGFVCAKIAITFIIIS